MEYIKCINTAGWEQTVKENGGNLIFREDFKSTCNNQCYSDYKNNNTHFQLSTKEAYDAQFVVKEPEFILPEKWYIKANTKEEADIMYPYFNKISKGHASWSPSNEVMRNKYYARFNQLEYEMGVAKNELNPLIPIITFEQFKKYVLKEEIVEEKVIEEKVIEPLPQFKIIETIETITKVENNEGNQFFIGDRVVNKVGIVYTIKEFKYNSNNTNILAVTNIGNIIGIDKIEHYIEPKTDYKILEYKTEGVLVVKLHF